MKKQAVYQLLRVLLVLLVGFTLLLATSCWNPNNGTDDNDGGGNDLIDDDNYDEQTPSEPGGTGTATVTGLSPTATKKWTVLLYIDADNDLEIFGIRDLNEAEYGMHVASQAESTFGDNVSVVALLDRTGGTGDTYTDQATEQDGSDWTGGRYYEIKADSTHDDNGDWEYGTFTSELISDLGEVNMGNAETLKNFISFGKNYYPAENYALILWNHGGGVRDGNNSTEPVGIRAVAYDEGDLDDALYVSEITDVLGDEQDVTVLGMDACLMGMAEIAYEYRPADSKFGADYYVGSPLTEPGDGWEYHDILIRMKDAGISSLDGAGFSGILVDAYKYRYDDLRVEQTDGDEATLTAVDNSKIADVKTALDALAAAMKDDKSAVEAIRGSLDDGTTTIDYFNENDSNEWIGTPHFDLYDLASRISTDGSVSDHAKTAAASLMTAIEDAVIRSWAGTNSYFDDNEDGKYGLGIFFPDGDYQEPDGEGGYYAADWTCVPFYSYLDITDVAGEPYGKLDFLEGGTAGNNTVESWYEMLEYWYDNDNSITDYITW